MIVISAKSELSGFKKIFLSLYNSKYNNSDLELLREESLLLEIKNPVVNRRFFIKNRSFGTKFDYDKYIKGGSKIAENECKYWNSQFFENNKISEIVSYLKQNPLSKRAIINLWKDNYKDLNKSAPCLSYVFFRKSGEYLNMISHMRANDAYKYLLVDVDTLRAVQAYVSRHLGLKVGSYIHFVDSLHLYKESERYIQYLYSRLHEKNY